jgi:hypothetical protein
VAVEARRTYYPLKWLHLLCCIVYFLTTSPPPLLYGTIAAIISILFFCHIFLFRHLPRKHYIAFCRHVCGCTCGGIYRCSALYDCVLHCVIVRRCMCFRVRIIPHSFQGARGKVKGKRVRDEDGDTDEDEGNAGVCLFLLVVFTAPGILHRFQFS